MRVVVTEVTGRGGVRRGMVDASGRSDAGRWVDLIERAALDLPPPYRPVEGRPVYHIRAEDKIVVVAERELVGPLQDLVMATLAASGAETEEPDDPASLRPRGQQPGSTGQPGRLTRPGAAGSGGMGGVLD